ncbi:MAG TPA: DUF2087 domain-containing protein [Anaerolineaceae bacterium]|nr:DUF2087 domain-containing protein [Anaerolineaceae bacterium]
MNTTPVTREIFIKRIADLCLKSGLLGLPKDERDSHILLKSMILLIGPSGDFSQQEIDAKLKTWISEVSLKIEGLDHVTLRRWLIDFGYLTRNANGTHYRVVPGGPRPELFDPAVEQIDILEAVRGAQEEMERRKREFMEKRGKNA